VSGPAGPGPADAPIERGSVMLAEKFFLMLEALIRTRAYADGSLRVVSTSPHVPVKLPKHRPV
jgi:hypothetical protein